MSKSIQYSLISTNNATLTPIETILTNRGIPLNEIQHYLHTTDQDILNPLLIANIKKGAQLLIKHISQNNKIFIQVDSDCDGYTSSAILLNYLYNLFPHFVTNNISYRFHEGKQHGLIPETIPEDIKLVIAPDSSSNDIEQHKILAEKGIDILVIDHHEVDTISPYACIINNQSCDYSTKSLSGAGMVYKFCSFIDEQLNTNYADQQLDLVALGLIADMMDLRDFETRQLVVRGLASITNPYLKRMIEKQSHSLKGEVIPSGIAFYIAPYVNATTRMGTQEEKRILFESMLDYRGYELIPSTKRGCKGQEESIVEQACRNCVNIKNRQTTARDNSLKTIKQIIEEKNLLINKILVIKLQPNESINKNLTGLIANQLVSLYQRPVLILNQTILEDGTIAWEGSGRGYDKSDLHDFKKFLNNTNLIEYAEGHSNALGVGIKDSDFVNFINYCNLELKDFDFSPKYMVDFIYQSNTITPDNIYDIASLQEYWGQGVEEALVAIENIKIQSDNIRLMAASSNNPTLKITLPNGISLIKFRSSNEEYQELYSELGCVTINIVGKCERNIWNGIISPQIKIEDYEIVGKTKYYF